MIAHHHHLWGPTCPKSERLLGDPLALCFLLALILGVRLAWCDVFDFRFSCFIGTLAFTGVFRAATQLLGSRLDNLPVFRRSVTDNRNRPRLWLLVHRIVAQHHFDRRGLGDLDRFRRI